MSRWHPDKYLIGISGQEICVIDEKNRRTCSLVPLSSDQKASGAIEEWATVIEVALAQAGVKKGATSVVSVADCWARYFALAVPLGLKSLSELRALAQGRMRQLFGDASEPWTIEADWQSQGSILVCAMPERLIEAIKLAVSCRGGRVESIQSSGLRLLGKSFGVIPDDCWVCCRMGEDCLALRIDSGKVLHARRLHGAPDLADQRLVDFLNAESLRIGKENPPVLCLLGLPQAKPGAEHVAGMRHVSHRLPEYFAQRSPSAMHVAEQGLT